MGNDVCKLCGGESFVARRTRCPFHCRGVPAVSQRSTSVPLAIFYGDSSLELAAAERRAHVMPSAAGGRAADSHPPWTASTADSHPPLALRPRLADVVRRDRETPVP